METAREKARIDINRKQRQGHNPNSVLDDDQRQRGQGQDGLRPRGPEEEVAGQQTHDQQGHTGANPAAFFGDLDGDSGQRKDEPGPKNGNAQQLEPSIGELRRPRLQPEDGSVQEEVGEGNHQKQEQHGKEARSESSATVAQNESANPDNDHGKHRDEKLVILAQRGGVLLPEPVAQSAGEQQPQSRPPTRLDIGEDPSSFQKEERCAYQGYENDVGIFCPLEREPDQQAQ